MPPNGDDVELFDAKAFGASLAARRKSRDIPQDQLALAVGISRVQLQNIESGLSDRAKKTPANPRLTTLLRLCRELDVRVVIDVAHPTGMVVRFDDDSRDHVGTG